MRIAVVLPPSPNDKWIFREDKHGHGHYYACFPYHASVLVGLLKSQLESVSIEIIDGQRDDLDSVQTLARLKASAPDFVICYLSEYYIPDDRLYAETGIPTIGLIMEQYLDHEEAIELYNLKIPFICKEEVEFPILDGLREFIQTGAIVETPGFMILQEDQSYRDTGNAPLGDISTLPLPDFDAFQPNLYKEASEKKFPESPAIAHNTFWLNTQKGCPYTCTFCGQARAPAKSRFQSPDQIISQLRVLKEKHGFQHFMFFDNDIGAKLSRAKELCRKIIDADLKITFEANNRVELFDDELYPLLAQAGCSLMRLGIETNDPELLDYVNKGMSEMRMREVVGKLHDHGVGVHFYLTPGIPGEDRESIERLIDFCVEVEPTSFSSSPLAVTPGSPFHESLKKTGMLIEYDWSKYENRDLYIYRNASYPSAESLRDGYEYLSNEVTRRLCEKMSERPAEANRLRLLVAYLKVELFRMYYDKGDMQNTRIVGLQLFQEKALPYPTDLAALVNSVNAVGTREEQGNLTDYLFSMLPSEIANGLLFVTFRADIKHGRIFRALGIAARLSMNLLLNAEFGAILDFLKKHILRSRRPEYVNHH